MEGHLWLHSELLASWDTQKYLKQIDNPPTPKSCFFCIWGFSLLQEAHCRVGRIFWWLSKLVLFAFEKGSHSLAQGGVELMVIFPEHWKHRCEPLYPARVSPMPHPRDWTQELGPATSSALPLYPLPPQRILETEKGTGPRPAYNHMTKPGSGAMEAGSHEGWDNKYLLF